MSQSECTGALDPYRSAMKANGQNQLVPSSPTGSLGCHSLFTSWKIVFDPPDEFHPYLCDAVTLQRVLDKLDIHGHLNLGDGRGKRAVNPLTTPPDHEAPAKDCEDKTCNTALRSHSPRTWWPTQWTAGAFPQEHTSYKIQGDTSAWTLAVR